MISFSDFIDTNFLNIFLILKFRVPFFSISVSIASLSNARVPSKMGYSSISFQCLKNYVNRIKTPKVIGIYVKCAKMDCTDFNSVG